MKLVTWPLPFWWERVSQRCSCTSKRLAHMAALDVNETMNNVDLLPLGDLPSNAGFGRWGDYFCRMGAPQMSRICLIDQREMPLTIDCHILAVIIEVKMDSGQEKWI